MALFIPNVLRVENIHSIAYNNQHINDVFKGEVPKGTEFQKVYFAELAKKYYMQDGNLEALLDVARVFQEEHYGAGGTNYKRFRVVFKDYNITVFMEEVQGKLIVKSA